MSIGSNLVLLAGLVIGLAYGAVGLLSGFCLMSSMRGWTVIAPSNPPSGGAGAAGSGSGSERIDDASRPAIAASSSSGPT